MPILSKLAIQTQLLAMAAILGATTCGATEAEIGRAVTIEKTVVGSIAGVKKPIAQDDAVFKNEVVETGVESLARLKFLDNTLLFVGPSSTVKLDSFVYNPDNTASRIVLNASKGAFRFVSGNSDHRAYEIRTPYGSLGTSGTTLGFVIANGRMIAVLKQGAMVVCPHARLTASRSHCIAVTAPDTAVIVTRSGARGPVPKSGDMRDFGDICGSICKRLFPQ